MYTAASLKTYTTKDLAQMAKKRGVAGWHSMRKDDLIRALVRASNKDTARSAGATRRRRSESQSSPKSSRKATRPQAGSRTTKPSTSTQRGGQEERLLRKDTKSSSKISPPKLAGSTTAKSRKPSSNGHAASAASSKPKAKAKGTNGAPKRKPPRPQTPPETLQKIQEANASRERLKDLANTSNASHPPDRPQKDRLVLMVRDSYWLHAYWELMPTSIERAQAALASNWHNARPTLRLVEVPQTNSTATSERVIREIGIHGGVSNWYIDVSDPPHTYRAEIGYLTSDGHFHRLARSNSVTTPRPGSTDLIDGHWADVLANSDKIYAMSGGYGDSVNGELQEMFEQRLRRPMGGPATTRFGAGADAVLERGRKFSFNIDAEMIVYGMTHPDAYVTMGGEPVKLRPDGSFTARLELPDRRQVIPLVASSSDGVEEQTIVLAVERNTKVMEPRMRDDPQ
ncbi:MAG: DUF4912 domain-containing protein [Pirellulaceae bacterium]